MAWNPLDWLLSGKLNQQPAPVSVGPELRAYNPSYSERFSDSIYELLGGGPQASLAHQNFARGVPNLLMATPIGIGLSAADLVRAQRANDPMGAAAAALGMVPGAGRLGAEARPVLSKAEIAMQAIEEALYGKPTAVATVKPKMSSADSTDAALKVIEEILGPAPAPVLDPSKNYFRELSKPQIPAGWEPMPKQTAMSADWLHPDDFKFENGQWIQKVETPATKKAGQVPESSSNPFYSQQNKFGNYDIIHKGTGELHDVAMSEVPAQQLVEDYGKNIASNPNFKGFLWQGTKAEPAPAAKQILDYEKDDNGLYHIFDAVSGKTVKVVDTPNQAKAWITSEEAKAKLPASSFPIKESSPNQTVFENLGTFPRSVPFTPPPQAIEHGYVTPAVHGTVMNPGDWKTPNPYATVGGAEDALRLPSDELGVHFGTPDQARHFTGRVVNDIYAPRTYPTVLQTGKSLELPDMGTWHVDKIKDALKRLNIGEGYGVSHGKYTVGEPFAHAGAFPNKELEPITNIAQMRDYLTKKGFNSVNYINSVEGPGQRSYIMFNPSPEAPNFVSGVRSPFASFDPAKLARPELAASIAALLGIPALASEKETK